MTLTTCPDCRREVSRAATSCPQCGRPLRQQGGIGRAIRWAVLAVLVLVTSAVIGGIALWVLFSPQAAMILRREGLVALPAPRSTPTGPVGYVTFVRERAREDSSYVEGRVTFVNDSAWWLRTVIGECTARDPDGKKLGTGGFLSNYDTGDARVPPDSNISRSVTISVVVLSSVHSIECKVTRTLIDETR